MEPMTRRELLSKSTVLLLMVPVAACSSNNSTPDSGIVLPDEDAASCNGVFSIGTINDSHTHSLCVPTGDLTNPPSAGNTYTTSNTLEHTHTVPLTQMQLTTIQSGGSVTVTTTDPSPYPHTFTIKKA